MKRLVSISLALIILITSAGAVSSSKFDKMNENELKKLIVEVKKKLSITEDYKNFNTNQKIMEGRTYLSLNWSDETKKPKEISVIADKEGRIYRVYKFDEFEAKRGTRKTNSEIEKLAEETFRKLNPQICGEFKLDENQGVIRPEDTTVFVTFSRYHDGIKVIGDQVMIEFDIYSGNLQSMNMKYTPDLDFNSLKSKISESEAFEIFKDNEFLKPVYSPYYKNGVKTYKLAYTGKLRPFFVDAISGKIFFFDNSDGMKEEMAKSEDGLSSAEIKDIDRSIESKSLEAAEVRARDLFEIPKSAKLNSAKIETVTGKENIKVLNLYFSDKDETYFARLSAKELSALGYSFESNEKSKEISFKDAEIKLIQSLKRWMVPIGDYEEIKPVNAKEKSTQNFTFLYKYNGALVSDEGMYAEVSGSTGKVSYFYRDVLQDMPDIITPNITLEEAYKILKEKVGIFKYYILNEDEDGKTELKLAYKISSDDFDGIDPLTGEVNYSGIDRIKPINTDYKDKDKIKDFDKVTELARFGIGFKGEYFKPSNEVTAGEFAKLLLLAVDNPYINDNDEIEQKLIEKGIAAKEEIKLDNPLTRIIEAKWTIRALGLGKIAEKYKIFSKMFKDSDKLGDDLGYANIATEFKFVDALANENFDADRKVNRNEALLSIYNLLNY